MVDAAGRPERNLPGLARRDRLVLAPQLAAELRALRDTRDAGPDAPVFCGLKGGPLQATILAAIIRRCALRREIHIVPVQAEQLRPAQAGGGEHRQQQTIALALVAELALPDTGPTRRLEQPP